MGEAEKIGKSTKTEIKDHKINFSHKNDLLI